MMDAIVIVYLDNYVSHYWLEYYNHESVFFSRNSQQKQWIAYVCGGKSCACA